MGGDKLYEFLQYAVAVYAFDFQMGEKAFGSGVPFGRDDARAVTGLQYLRFRTVERMNLDYAFIVYESHYVVAVNGMAALGEFVVCAVGCMFEPVYFFCVYFFLGSQYLLRCVVC